ncbi:MAG TPA: hypothetical protein VFT79_09940 [Solirubrobacterales bacterium]|nr:hypothetical protein [Solirubrobacterales bacterium]
MTAAPSASAGVVDSYCSPTGDYCTGILREGGRVKLSISTFSFTGAYELTVKLPGVCRQTKTFRLRSKPHGIYSSRIDFARNFSCDGPGRYAVTWSWQGSQLGPALHGRL